METKTINVNGLEIKTSVNENEFEERKNGTYEQKYVDWFINNSDDIDLFLDVGAFCGYFGLHVANEDVPVISFEPSRSAHTFMVENFINNGFMAPDGYLCHNKAVSNENNRQIEGGIGGCEFFEPVSDIDRKGNDTVETITIEKALDNYILDRDYSHVVPDPDNLNIAIKVDTEGMEYEALDGVGDWWDYIDYTCVEFHPMYVDDNEITKTLNLLEDKNITPIDIESDPYKDNCNIRFVKGDN